MGGCMIRGQRRVRTEVDPGNRGPRSGSNRSASGQFPQVRSTLSAALSSGWETGIRARTSNLVSMATGFRPRRAPPSCGLLRDARELLLRAAHSRPPAPRAYRYGATPGGEMTGTAIRFFSSSQHAASIFGLLNAYGFEGFINSSIDGLIVHIQKRCRREAPFGLEIGSAKTKLDDALTRGVTSGLGTFNSGEGETSRGKEDESRADIDRR